MKRRMKRIIDACPLSWRGWIVYTAAMMISTLLCLLLARVGTVDAYAPLIFVLAVLIISMLTEGYFYGVLSALTGTVAVNWAFTYPYAKLDFSIYGYPLTFLTMLSVCFTMTTITRRLQAYEKIQHEAEKERIRANLLRAISHDLRTPLTAISGSISAVLESGDSLSPQEQRELLHGARQDAEWLHRMVENLLSITRMNSRTDNILKQESEMLEEVLSEAQLKFLRQNPDMEVRISAPEEMLFVPMDAMLIEQVLLNLMYNAVQHGQTTTCINIKAEVRENHVAIIVADNGKGIAPDAFDRLFKGSLMPQAGLSADKSRGMGIGLLLCKTIVEAHGGAITAENLPQGGAAFSFTLQKGINAHEY